MRGVSFHYNDLAWGLNGVSGKGWHTQLGSGYLSCTLAFPASPQQPCGKTLKRETTSRMKTIIMQRPVYCRVPWTEPGLRYGGGCMDCLLRKTLLWWWCRTAVLYSNTEQFMSWIHVLLICLSHASIVENAAAFLLQVFGHCVLAVHKDCISSCDTVGWSTLQGGAGEGSVALLCVWSEK